MSEYLKETAAGETRVAITPAATAALIKSKLEVLIETRRGLAAGFEDAAYAAKGAKLADRRKVLASADILLQVRTSPPERTGRLRIAQTGLPLDRLLRSAGQPEGHRRNRGQGRVADLDGTDSPHHARAVDGCAVQSGQSGGLQSRHHGGGGVSADFPDDDDRGGNHSAGARYLSSAPALPACRPSPPPSVLGPWSAPSTCGRRSRSRCNPSARSLSNFRWRRATSRTRVDMPRRFPRTCKRKQAALMAKVIAESDVIVTTAAVPGKPAPKLIFAPAVEQMQPGSVIVDLAAERGGNCELTVPGRNDRSSWREDHRPSEHCRHRSLSRQHHVCQQSGEVGGVVGGQGRKAQAGRDRRGDRRVPGLPRGRGRSTACAGSDGNRRSRLRTNRSVQRPRRAKGTPDVEPVTVGGAR